jgi:tetratricopeptide (TPR) repeat protein
MRAGTSTVMLGFYHRLPWSAPALGLAASLLVLPAGASAQEEAGARERALELFDQGGTAYQEGRFEDAARLFRSAHETFPEAVLLYNLARAEENLGHWIAAAEAYQGYLDAAEQAEDRPGIERRIVTLRERAEEESATPPDPPPPPRAPPPPASTPVPYASIVLGAAGVLGIGAAAIVGQLAVDQWEQARDAPVHLDGVRLEATANDLALAANVSYAIAGAVLLGAAIALIVELTAN